MIVAKPAAQRLPRLAAGACLLAMLVTQQWAWLLTLFLFASVDGSHRTLLTQEAAGVAIILRHDERGAAAVRGHDRSLGHAHCLPAKLITLFAADTSSQTDHVIQFAAAPPQLSRPAGAAPVLPINLVFAPVLTGAALPSPLAAHQISPQPRPPPAGSALLLQLRSTVLLI